MISQLVDIYALKNEVEFMRLTREYYSFRYEDFDFMIYYFTHVKILEERIRGIQMILDDDKQIFLCFGIIFPEEFQYFIKIWAMTPGMIADKARNMLLEKERRRKILDPGIVGVGLVATTRHSGKKDSRGRAIMPSRPFNNNVTVCSGCGKSHEADDCWKLHFEKAPEWLQENWVIEKRSRKRKWEELQQ